MADVIADGGDVVDAPVGAETQAQDTASAQPTAESKPTEPDPAKETKQALRGVQKRIDELTRARYEAEERGRQETERARQEAEYWKQQATQAKQSIGPPRADQFQDYEQYLSAIAKHNAESVVEQRIQAERQASMEWQQRQMQEANARQAQERYQKTIESKVSEAVKKFPDFVDVVTSPELPGMQGTPAFGAILESELGAEVMYYLGKNPVQAHRIVSLSPINQVREIGRIEASLSAGKVVSNAPPPPASVDTKSGSAAKDPSKMSYEEFVAYRRKQIAARR